MAIDLLLSSEWQEELNLPHLTRERGRGLSAAAPGWGEVEQDTGWGARKQERLEMEEWRVDLSREQCRLRDKLLPRWGRKGNAVPGALSMVAERWRSQAMTRKAWVSPVMHLAIQAGKSKAAGLDAMPLPSLPATTKSGAPWPCEPCGLFCFGRPLISWIPRAPWHDMQPLLLCWERGVWERGGERVSECMWRYLPSGYQLELGRSSPHVQHCSVVTVHDPGSVF